jgi:hypothetical protein
VRTTSILYLVGSGRSGTTLLSRLLDLEKGYRAVGEVRYIADRATWVKPCGCGHAHESCEFWKPRMARWDSPERLAAWRGANYAEQRDQLAGYLRPASPRDGVQRGLAELRSVYEDLDPTGDIIVDESKTPWLGYLLSTQPWADVRFVELVKHPGEVVRSRHTPKDYQPATPREVSAKHWLRTTLTAETVRIRSGAPWLRIPYERLVNEPEAVLRQIIGRRPQGIHYSSGSWSFESEVNHIYLSNADKLRRGTESIRPASATTRSLPDPGPWERMAIRYWDTWLRRHDALARDWSAAVPATGRTTEPAPAKPDPPASLKLAVPATP